MIKNVISILLFFSNLFSQPQLANYQPADKIIIVKLDKKLNEISGLALSPEEKLFAHDDEEGKIFQLDIKTGEIVKEFDIGRKDVEKDFEGLAVAGNKFYLVTSKGNIYEFEEGNDGEKIEFKKYETSLRNKYDVEGLCYDPRTESLLLACKEFAGKNYEDNKAVYSFDLLNKKLVEKPTFLISLDKLDKKWDVDKFKPSGIAHHPESGSFFILGGKGFVIIEISETGEILGEMILDSNLHNQPEGIVILNNNTMIISDEGGKGKASLTFYPYNE